MAIDTLFPEFDELLTMVGEAGRQMAAIDAAEGAAGNISVYVGWPVEPRRQFPLVETIDLPVAVPGLAHHSLLVTGSGRRLREITDAPAANLGFVTINEGGRTGQLYTSPRRRFARLTSELNSHLAVHHDFVCANHTDFHAIIHAQPPYLTYLSQIPAYQDEEYLNRHLLRWEPETIIQLPEGVGLVPFHVPGSADQMQATLEALRSHRLIIWSKRGVVARSETPVKHASDYIEYAETGARYEYLNLVNQERGEGLSVEEIRAICKAFGVDQSIF
jgi:rhamnulose-1-phosphate aldolase